MDVWIYGHRIKTSYLAVVGPGDPQHRLAPLHIGSGSPAGPRSPSPRSRWGRVHDRPGYKCPILNSMITAKPNIMFLSDVHISIHPYIQISHISIEIKTVSQFGPGPILGYFGPGPIWTQAYWDPGPGDPQPMGKI